MSPQLGSAATRVSQSGAQGGLSHFPPKFEHIFVAVITFFPLSSVQKFLLPVLLIVCALRLYVKSLYRHFFLEDIAKNARVTQKMAPPKLHDV